MRKNGAPYQTLTRMTEKRAQYGLLSQPNFAETEAVENVVEGGMGGIEQPPPAERGQSERNDPRHQHHAAPFALALGRQVVDQMRGDKPDQRFEKHRGEREDRGLFDHHPEHVARQQKFEIGKPDKTRLRLVQHRQIDRIERRIDDEAGDDDDERQAHQKRDGRAPPHEELEAAAPARRRMQADARQSARQTKSGRYRPSAILSPSFLGAESNARSPESIVPAPGLWRFRARGFAASRNDNQARSVPSSSFSAHLITSSIFSLPCVTLATMTVLIAWL